MNKNSQVLAIEKFIENLNEKKSLRKQIVIGRDEEIRKVIEILSRKTKNNPLLIGYPGVGKTAVVEGFVQKILNGQVPNYLKNKIVYQLDMITLMAGTKYQGEMEERLKFILDFIAQPENNAILFIDEFHLIMNVGRNQGFLDFSNLIKPALSRGELQCIGATTWEEYQQIEKDGALNRRFNSIFVEEPTTEDCIKILQGICANFEIHYQLKIEKEALEVAVRLSQRYLVNNYLPDKAIDLLDETCGRIKSEMWYKPRNIEKIEKTIQKLETEEKSQDHSLILTNQEILVQQKKLQELVKKSEEETKNIQELSELKKKYQEQEKHLEVYYENGNYHEVAQLENSLLPELKNKIAELEEKVSQNSLKKYLISKEDVAFTVARKLNLPVSKILVDEQQKLLFLWNILNQRVKGQSQALQAIANAILRARVGIQNPQRPLGSFLFLGPTGVGKTETALTLAEYLFDQKDNLIRLDMSEFMEPHSVSKLLGAPPGYIGFEQCSLLEIVRQKPYSVILVDEIEKAHLEIINIFLQILDNGLLTLANGRKINFRNTIIIMTSNLGSELYFQEKLPTILQEELNLRLKKYFKPEILNRFDEIIFFNSLSAETTREIIRKELNYFCQRVYQEKFIKLEYKKDVVEKILYEAYSEEYGARSVKRYIEQNIGTMIARRIIINGFLKPGSSCLIETEEKTQEIKITPLSLLKENK